MQNGRLVVDESNQRGWVAILPGIVITTHECTTQELYG